jgi:hypothetical protein
MIAPVTTSWTGELVDRLTSQLPAGYSPGGEPACEPTALAGLALCSHGAMDAARTAARWLADRQSRSGSIGVTVERPTPCWPTALAMMLWHFVDRDESRPAFADNLRRALNWTLHEHGQPAPRKPYFGHDSTIVGWSWAANTHSWIEPTAMFVRALKTIGQGQHARTRDGVKLLLDRLLPTGGCNYGNTIVLGQALLPHVQPTGLAMWALAGESKDDLQIERSLTYLEREASPKLATASLCYGLLALDAHGRQLPTRENLLCQAFDRIIGRGGSPYALALLGMASAGAA